MLSLCQDEDHKLPCESASIDRIAELKRNFLNEEQSKVVQKLLEIERCKTVNMAALAKLAAEEEAIKDEATREIDGLIRFLKQHLAAFLVETTEVFAAAREELVVPMEGAAAAAKQTEALLDSLPALLQRAEKEPLRGIWTL